MKLIIFTLLIIVLLIHPSLQCNCKDKCTKCCKSGNFRLVPLYELYESKTDEYFYTVSLREIKAAVEGKDFIRKRIVGLVAVGEVDCEKRKTLVPVKRFINEDNGDYLFQTADEVRQGRKYSIEGVAFYGAATEDYCGATVSLYRFWNGERYIYSTDLVEGKQRAGRGFINEGTICYIWPVTETTITTSTTTTTTTTTTRDPLDNPGSCSMALTKLFRLYRNSTDSFLFTPTYQEAKDAYQNQYYDPQLSPGYVAPENSSCSCSFLPVYRVDRSVTAEKKQDQLFTTSKKEADDAVSGLGYKDLNIAYYCAEKINSCGATVPYYRYRRNNDIQSHFYTTDKDENIAVKSTPEGILCYIWPPQN